MNQPSDELGVPLPEQLRIVPRAAIEIFTRYGLTLAQLEDVEQIISKALDDHTAALRAEVEALRAERGNLEKIYRQQELTEIVSYLQNMVSETPADGDNDRFIAGIRYAISAIKPLDL